MTDSNRLPELLDRYFDRGLSPDEKLELETALRDSEEARALFWDRAHLHSALRNTAQRRRGVRMAREMAEQAGNPPQVSLPATSGPARELPPISVLPPPARRRFSAKAAFALAATIVVAAIGTWMAFTSTPVGRLTDVTNPEWRGTSLRRGDVVRRGTLHLTKGVAQIEFLNGAKVVVQGPADMRITDGHTMRLLQGRLSAEVPPSAHGFTVNTPEGSVVDLGTRFGVQVAENGNTDVHVFEGAVNLKAQSGVMKLTTGAAIAAISGKLTPKSADPSIFPRPTSTLTELLKSGDFERDTFLEGTGIPSSPAVWNGDSAQVVGTVGSVVPKTGTGMLSFNLQGDQTVNEWQLIDLTPVKHAVPGAAVQARFSAWVNRHRSAATQGTFAVTIAAFRGSRDRVSAMWSRRTQEALALHQQTLTADLNPTTWEKLSAHITVPATADFLLVHIGANWLRDAPVNGTYYFHLSANNESQPNPRLRRRAANADVESNIIGGAVLNQLTHHVVSYNAAAYEWRWYRNGAFAASLLDNDGVSTLADVNNWIGRSQYNSNSNFEGTFNEFRIYDYALSEEQIVENNKRGPDLIRISPEPKHRWTFDGPPNQATPNGTVIADKIGGATAYLRGEGAAFDRTGDGIALPGGSGATQAYIDLPNGVASGTIDGGKRFSNVTYEFWANQKANRVWSRFFDFGTGTAGELEGPGFPPIGHFADAATLEITLPPQASAAR